MDWLKKIFGKTSKISLEKITDDINQNLREIRNAGTVNNEHYTDNVDIIKKLKREGKNKEAIEILLRSVDATEAESKFAGAGWGVAPWYYEQLAIIYRKEKLYQKEIEILERYSKQTKAPGIGPQKLAMRLIKAKELGRKI